MVVVVGLGAPLYFLGLRLTSLNSPAIFAWVGYSNDAITTNSLRLSQWGNFFI